jgi:cyclopropane fatty-acyl-phospholipid synthase-like methyltransferase
MLYRLYQLARAIPGVGAVFNALLRRSRSFFWKYRPTPSKSEGGAPFHQKLFSAFIESHIDDDAFVLVEVGSGNGSLLRELATRYPQGKFIGVDIRKAAVAAGNAYLAEHGIENVHLICASCLDDALPWECDYLVSQASLIYLDRQEIELFLRKRLYKTRKKALLREIISVTGKTEVTHFFAHPLQDIARHSDNAFDVSVSLSDYEPLKRANHWSGADIVITRKQPT